jgi:DNA-binding NarL/FixJ family response regulator
LSPERLVKHLRILIVDDHAFIRRAVRSLLEARQDWEVCGEASDGLEAVEQAGKLHPDVVVMDMLMPGVGGLEATRRIHHSFPESHVVILTLHSFPDLNRAVRDAGAEGIVLKTDSDRYLVPAVESVSGSHPFFRN